MSRRLRSAVYGIMLGRGDHAKILRIVSLKTGYKSDSHAAGEEGIFAISFLPASPARITKDVDIRRPEVETFHNVAPSRLHCEVVLGSRLDADDDRHLVNQGVVESSRKPNGLRKNGGGPRIGDTVQSLAPPVVLRHIKPRNCPRLVHELGSLFLESHAADEVVNPDVDRLAGILIGSAGIGLGGTGSDDEGEKKGGETEPEAS